MKYAGAKAMRELAREDARVVLKKLIDEPRGLGNQDRETPDSIAYVAELRRVLQRLNPRRTNGFVC